jgi:hypothetical protein
MRAIFSVLGLLLVVAVIGMLAKKQLHSVSTLPSSPSENNPIGLPATTPGATVQQQSLEIGQQVKKSVEESLQQPRTIPDEK